MEGEENKMLESDSLMVQEIQEKKNLLKEGANSIVVNMHLFNLENTSLENLKIENNLPQFNYYGASGSELGQELKAYLTGMGENSQEDIDQIVQAILRISKSMVEGFNKESAWTMVRVSLPDSDFEIPRWHSDGRYFDSQDKVYKLVATLKGHQTLFGEKIDTEAYSNLMNRNNENYAANKDNPEKFNAEDLKIREALTVAVKEKEASNFGEAVIYLVGDPNAAIHSEPNITTPRIFISVLPGYSEQIEEWKSRNTKK